MSRDEKQSYHHGNLREQLMDTAVKHLREVGIEKFSLRAIAKELKVSQTAPYRHFKDKNTLLAALATSGFETLKTEILTATKEYEDDAAAALQAAGIAYIRFARQNPEKYQLMFGRGIVDAHLYTELKTSGRASFQVLQDIVEQGVQQGVFKDQNSEVVANTAWALVHGLATLINDRLQWYMPEEAIEQQIQFSTKALIERI